MSSRSIHKTSARENGKGCQSPDRTVSTTIDAALCVGCGQCISVCPKETLTLIDGKAVVSGTASMDCDHCAAACPTGAVRVAAVDPSLGRFQTFVADTRWRPHGRFDVAELVNLMGSRRSCRNFTERPVAPALLEDLVKVAVTAPSGTNCQPWTFTILPNRAAVLQLGRQVGDFFRRTNRLAARPWLRTLLKWIGRPDLDRYFRQHYDSVARALADWDRGERDRLFHGATAVIVVAADRAASCPAEDALLAAGQILLAAHAMGLGSCLIGFVIEAMRRDVRITRTLGIADREMPCAVVALGWPDEAYRRVAGRKPVQVRYWQA